MKCAICKNSLELVKDFGSLPLSNNLVMEKTVTKKYPLRLAFCKECELLQLAEKLDSEILFKEDYPYRSGVSQVFKEHCKKYAESLKDEIGSKEFRILEIGGNDGTLAREFLSLYPNVKYTLVDPCYLENIPRLEGIKDYFSKELFGNKKFDLIIFQNSFAHIPNPVKLVSDCNSLLADNGHIAIELPIAEYTIKYSFWETVYFEHQYYYSISALKKLLKKVNLELVKIEHFQEIQGGSARLFFGKEKSNLRKFTTTPISLFDISKSISVFEERRKNLKIFVRDCDKTLIGITAPAKAALLLALLDEKEMRKISFIVDEVKVKQGKFLACHNRNIEIKPFSAIPKNSIGIILSKNYEKVLIQKTASFGVRGIFTP